MFFHGSLQDLANAILHPKGHGGSIKAVVTNRVGGGQAHDVLTLTQARHAASGNTTVTTNLTNVTIASQFVDGADPSDGKKDNVFITHPIPRNDYQYSWITASLREGVDIRETPGHIHSFTNAALGDTTGSLRYENTYEFLTASNREGTNIIDFAGLNTYILDTLDTSGSVTDTFLTSYNLTGVLHHRQGPYGWPSWKQVRAGQTQMCRHLSKNNISDKEMLKTFNCGVGFCLIIDPKNLNKVQRLFTKNYKPYVIGKITVGPKKIKLNDKIQWFK